MSDWVPILRPQARPVLKSHRWLWLLLATSITALGLGLIFMLTVVTDNQQLQDKHYGWLLGTNIVVAVVLGSLIAYVAIRLWQRWRQKKFGSQLLIKLATIFALVGVIPGVLIYVVSYQFVSRSIEIWFDARVESALEAGLSLGRNSLDNMANSLANKTRTAALNLADSGVNPTLELERIREQLDAQDAILFNATGQALSTAGASRFILNPPHPSSSQMQQAKARQVSIQLEGLDGGQADRARIQVLAWVPSKSFALTAGDHYLWISSQIPPGLASNSLAVESAYREYQERALGRVGLKRMYIGTLTLALFLSVFGGVLMAIILGNQLARPLLLLADGVNQVAQGDLSPKTVSTSSDELGGLTRAFADMTQQLADARHLASNTLDLLAAAKSQLQTVLDNLSSGVIVMDVQGQLISSNPSASRVLRVDLEDYQGLTLKELPELQEFADLIYQQFEHWQSESDVRRSDHWQTTFDLHHGEEGLLSILARGALLPDHRWLLVFDDITDLISAQRSKAWGEVARRLAHEIKNPLTPIQLSAERLGLKLSDKLSEDADRQLLARGVNTIVTQVQAMQKLVNEFRDYARLPAAELKPLDLNALIKEVLTLYDHQAEQQHIHLHLSADPDLPLIQGDASQLRQVIHNLVGNALDAVAESAIQDIHIGTKRVSTTGADGQAQSHARLRIIDSGPGFEKRVLQRAFEPYVTTKAKGTGLGLAVVRKIIDEHGARIELSNRQNASTAATETEAQGLGAQVSILFPLTAPSPEAALSTSVATLTA